ncbi:MAG: hypothetical protein ISQ22_06935 [Rhizobiales bacterium]|nr:hypothetical protein [Hyphomicrobiales bacterium]MBL6771087.1 hypothetical protein [Hyphomicrobiales bacterium]
MKILSAIFIVLLLNLSESHSLEVFNCTDSPTDQMEVFKKWDNCLGTVNYPSGSVFVGEWKKGQKFRGKQVYIDGTYYQGEWKNGVYHGKGIKTSKFFFNKEGVWQNGKFQIRMKVDVENYIGEEYCIEKGLVKGSAEYDKCLMELTLLN